jgi:hypothetical protein
MAVGSFNDLGTVMYGKVNADLVSGGGSIALAALGESSFRCEGDAKVVKIPDAMSCKGQEGVATLSCSDGRTARATYLATSCTTGYGAGTDSRGNRFGFTFGMSEDDAHSEIMSRLEARGYSRTPDLDNRIRRLADELRRNQESKISEPLGQVLAAALILYAGYHIAKTHATTGAPSMMLDRQESSIKAISPMEECSSNLDCSHDKFCLKPSGKITGQCVTPVDQYGGRTIGRPESNYGEPGTMRCRYNSDCLPGFQCSRELNACIKRP